MRLLIKGGVIAATTLVVAAGLPLLAAAPGIARSAPAVFGEAGEQEGPWSCEVTSELPPAAGPLASLDPFMLRLALGGMLAAQETALGIRPEQEAAWRAYSSALVDLVPSGERVARWKDKEKLKEAEAFDLSSDIAAAIVERGEKARRLEQAIAALKPVLTADQLRMAKQTQTLIVERLMRLAELRRNGGGFPFH